MIHALSNGLGLCIGAATIAYLVLALFRVARFDNAWCATETQPPVSILKPLSGDEPALYECLRSFCNQDYPEYQIVFGVTNADDDAIPVVRKVMAEFPALDLSLVIDGRVRGPNPKVSNLINMYVAAKHSVLVVSDSDVWVGPECLGAVIAPFDDRAVGAVTCLYKAKPIGGWESRFCALFVNDWVVPSVLVDVGMREVDFCFGPLTAVRREALETIGGFGKIATQLADDFVLGRLINRAGFRIKLSHYPVDTVVSEPDFRTMLRHELRWARTVRTCRAVDHVMSMVTCALPLTAMLALLTPSLPGYSVIAAAILLRMVLHMLVRAKFDIAEPVRPWLVPFREIVCFCVWAVSLTGRSIYWREGRYSIQREGMLAREDA